MDEGGRGGITSVETQYVEPVDGETAGTFVSVVAGIIDAISGQITK